MPHCKNCSAVFVEHVEEFKVLTWASKSPRLQLDMLQNQVQSMEALPYNVPDSMDLLQSWCQITQYTFRYLVESIPPLFCQHREDVPNIMQVVFVIWLYIMPDSCLHF